MLVPPVILIRWFLFCNYPANAFDYLYRMKNKVYTIVMALALLACNHSNKEIKERLTNSDSMAINYFKGDGTMDTVMAVKIIRDKQQLEQLVGYISGRSVEANMKCGYDGSLHFFKMNQVIQDVDFRMNQDGCMQFSFSQYGKPHATALSESAKELINSFRK
ncbi:MAG: hypothetical protein JWP81_3116 [Ferruginibacter sp.]|nr:hypothetical protein [Ferruginibacter sp.]